MPSFLSYFVLVTVLVLIQTLAALPWLLVLLRTGMPSIVPRSHMGWLVWRLIIGFGSAVVLLLGLGLFGGRMSDNAVEVLGRLYSSALHLQLLADLFVGVFAVLLSVWPKGGAVALSAFREGIRQPMFLLIVLFALFVILVIPFVPYFTFGEDHLMARELGLDVIMLVTVVFGAILASTSISDEIEGRTAITLISKPVSRRQFLLGKYVGILMASLVITGLLGWFFDWMMLFARWYAAADPVPLPSWAASFVQAVGGGTEREAFLRGACWWVHDATEALPGLVLGFCQVMVLLAISVCLATRLPVVANVVSCAVVYILSHLSPILQVSAESRGLQETLQIGRESTGVQMLEFVATVFKWLLPGLQLFKPTQITDAPVPLSDMALYTGEVALYALTYTVIVLLFGLVLFEDRDLA